MWFFYSLSFALLSSFGIFIIKKLSKKIDYLPLLYIFLIFNIPLTFVLVLFIGGIPNTTSDFYIYMGLSALLDTIAFVLAFLAISRSDISLLSPIAAFSPVFTTIIAAFTLGEVPDEKKLFGILIVILGVYLLSVSQIKKGILVPFKGIFTNKSVLFFLVSNLIWAITPILQKKAIFETNPQIPLFASLIGMCFGFVFLTPFAARRALGFAREVKSNMKWFLANGIGTAFGQAAAFTAFSLAYLGYVTSVFKLSILFTIILGGVFLKEKNIKERLLGAAVMVIGTILLALP